MKNLDRDALVELDVRGRENDTHAALSEDVVNAVLARKHRSDEARRHGPVNVARDTRADDCRSTSSRCSNRGHAIDAQRAPSWFIWSRSRDTKAVAAVLRDERDGVSA